MRRIDFITFSYPFHPLKSQTSSSFRMVWGWWKDNRKKYPSSLYVTVQGLNPPKAGGEKVSSGGDEGLNTLSSSILAVSKENPAVIMTPKIPVWSRLPGQNCKIPNCRQHGFEDAKFNQVPPRCGCEYGSNVPRPTIFALQSNSNF